HLRARCPQPPYDPNVRFPSNKDKPRTPTKFDLLGATGRELRTEAEITATGMFDTVGLLLSDVPKDSGLAKLGFRTDDVFLKLKGKGVKTGPFLIGNDVRKLNHWLKMRKREFIATIWRDQREQTLTILNP
ncbi:MAG: hypothetical protein ACYTF0_03610, partial [Planctomycetota bacterium]